MWKTQHCSTKLDTHLTVKVSHTSHNSSVGDSVGALTPITPTFLWMCKDSNIFRKICLKEILGYVILLFQCNKGGCDYLKKGWHLCRMLFIACTNVISKNWHWSLSLWDVSSGWV